jgi:hypothetical protein
MAQIPIIGSDGNPVRYAYLDNGNLIFQFEYYERFEGEGDYEIIQTVLPHDFESIARKFGLEPDFDILAIVRQISELGGGQELVDALNSKEISNSLWTWLS